MQAAEENLETLLAQVEEHCITDLINPGSYPARSRANSFWFSIVFFQLKIVGSISTAQTQNDNITIFGTLDTVAANG